MATDGAAATAEAFCRDLPQSLAVHLHQIDLLQERVLLLRLSPEDFARASFLDQRVVTREMQGAWFGWEQLERCLAGAHASTPPHFIFHVGHCGSTLLTRLLAELGVLPLREPLPLRALAEVHAELAAPYCRWSRSSFERRLEIVVASYSRGTRPAAVKASSFCNDLAIDLLAKSAASRATICYVTLRPYIASMLVGSSSRLDLLAMAPLRLRRFDARAQGGAGRLSEMRPGVIAAMSWLTEMSALAGAVDALAADRVHCIDFDAFLVDVPAGVRKLADHVMPGIPSERVAAATVSPSLKQYSKAPEHAFDAGVRRRVLAQAEAQFGDEILAGLRWSESAAARFEPMARAIRRFDGATR
jgi:hypothetical protein